MRLTGIHDSMLKLRAIDWDSGSLSIARDGLRIEAPTELGLDAAGLLAAAIDRVGIPGLGRSSISVAWHGDGDGVRIVITGLSRSDDIALVQTVLDRLGVVAMQEADEAAPRGHDEG